MKYLMSPALAIWLATFSVIAVAQETPDVEVPATEQIQTELDSGLAEASRDQINAAIQSYIAAFNARDVQKLVSHWSPQGVYISRTSGDRVVGRERLTEEFTNMFAGERVPNLSSTSNSIEFISPNVALERGTATVSYSQDEEVQTDYRIVYVKQDETWLIDRVTEDQISDPRSNYQQLAELEWMIGEWIDNDEGISIEMECRWTANQNFISRKFSVSSEQGVESSGLQVIGWDAKVKQIRSWLFDSNGGVITGTWTQSDSRWIVQSVATLPDGASGSFTSIFRPTEDGNYTWQKINQVLDGQLLPNIDEIVVQRK